MCYTCELKVCTFFNPSMTFPLYIFLKIISLLNHIMMFINSDIFHFNEFIISTTVVKTMNYSYRIDPQGFKQYF